MLSSVSYQLPILLCRGELSNSTSLSKGNVTNPFSLLTDSAYILDPLEGSITYGALFQSSLKNMSDAHSSAFMETSVFTFCSTNNKLISKGLGAGEEGDDRG